jgi:hypothetical protein
MSTMQRNSWKRNKGVSRKIVRILIIVINYDYLYLYNYIING